jgi:hypothetical protein
MNVTRGRSLSEIQPVICAGDDGAGVMTEIVKSTPCAQRRPVWFRSQFFALPRQSVPLAIAIVQEGGEASPVGCPDFKSEKGPLAGPWWVRLPLSSAKPSFAGDRRPYGKFLSWTRGCLLAPMENTTASASGTHRAGSLGAIAQHGRRRPRTVASRPQQSPLRGTLQCLRQIAPSPVLDQSGLA